MLLTDDETGTYWDHITGEGLHGPLQGERLETWGIGMTTLEVALREHPEFLLLRSKLSLLGRMMAWAMLRGPMRGRIPPFLFRRTMTEPDLRLPEMQIGLGVIGEREQRFYPLERIGAGLTDEFEGGALKIGIEADNGIPYAEREDGARPQQLFCRWYGFSVSFRGCEVYGQTDS